MRKGISTSDKRDVPEGDIILYQRSVDPKTGGVKRIPYLLKERTLMTGEVLKDARVALDSQFHEPMYPWSLTISGQAFRTDYGCECEEEVGHHFG